MFQFFQVWQKCYVAWLHPATDHHFWAFCEGCVKHNYRGIKAKKQLICEHIAQNVLDINFRKYGPIKMNLGPILDGKILNRPDF